MKKISYNDVDSWMSAITNLGYDFGSWGICGSMSAYDINGKIVGEWLQPFDTSDGRAYGWLVEGI